MTKVLLVDSYDSYTFNLYQLILDVIPTADIVIVRNDQFRLQELDDLVAGFDFIVIGPGPGDPRNASDIGCLLELLDYDIPVLGVCLGFQLICMKEGAQIRRLQSVKHGQVSPLQTNRCTIYPAGEIFQVTRYHSLYADISGIDTLEAIGWVNDVQDNGHIVMSVRHKSKPYVGVQYHPESARSENGRALIIHFFEFAKEWNQQHRHVSSHRLVPALKRHSIQPQALTQPTSSSGKVAWRQLDYILPTVTIAELLSVRAGNDFIMLDAAAEPSRYSMFAVLTGHEEKLRYNVGESVWHFGSRTLSSTVTTPTVWHFIAELMADRKVQLGPQDSPFWGGLAGYISYESGVESLEIKPLQSSVDQDDISLVFVERSIVLDHRHRRMYVQSIKTCANGGTDELWLDDMCQALGEALRTPPPSPPRQMINEPAKVELPDQAKYLANISKAQEYLAEGQSYELCLTAQTRITCAKRQPWDLYQSLRSRNPSPFAAYIKLDGIHLLSSSPERFLSWARDGHCQLRPIKGTVRKTPGMTYDRAVEILKDPKEVAENLMIVDLIRHDLHQIASNVKVPQLMQVEEYHTVYQLVSVITGEYKDPYTGFDILSRSLPPGSMTGAPKKRSVELLQKMEGRRRGLYSGVCGYLSVCGGGDWSVIIRSAFRYESDNTQSTDEDVWWIGAGGAITALSDPDAEWQEMLTKLQSTLPCFTQAPLKD